MKRFAGFKGGKEAGSELGLASLEFGPVAKSNLSGVPLQTRFGGFGMKKILAASMKSERVRKIWDLGKAFPEFSLYLCFLFLCIFGCKTKGNPQSSGSSQITINKNISTQHLYTSGMAEPVRKYPLSIDSRSKERSTPQITISPINGNIWELNFYKPAYELDSETGEWKSLEPIFGKYARRLRRTNVRDGIENNLAWIAYDDGLLLYDVQTGKISDFKRDVLFGNYIIEVIRPERDVIWLGTAGGLIYIDRKDKSIYEIKGLREVWISSIDRDKDRLWINGTYIYYPETGKIENIMERKGWPISNVTLFKIFDGVKVFASLHDNDPVVIMDNKEEIITTLEDMPRLCIFQDIDKNIWFVGNKFIKYDMRQRTAEIKYESDQDFYDCYDSGKYIYFRSANKFGRFDKGTAGIEAYPDAMALKYIVADKFFWLLGPDSITRLNKHNNDAAFRPMSEVKDIEKRIYDLAGSLYYEKDVIKKIKTAAEYVALSEAYKDKMILVQTNYNLIHHLKAENEEFEEIKDFVESTKVLLEKEIGYYMLSTSPLLAGDPETASEFYNLLAKKFPNGRALSWISLDGRWLIERAAKEFRDITENSTLTEEERLSRLGNLFFDVFQVSWNDGEVGYNMSYPFSLFEELIGKYPDGELAHHARVKMDTYKKGIANEGSDDDYVSSDQYSHESPMGEDNCSEISKLSNGDFFFDHILKSLEFENNTVIKYYLDMAKQNYSDVAIYCKGTESAKEALEKINKVNGLLDKYSWVLEIESKNKIYSLGDQIVINFTLKNMRDNDRKINVYKDRPNFGITIRRFDFNIKDRWYDVIFLRNFSLQDESKKASISIPGKEGKYSEKQVITDLSLDLERFDRGYGKFKIDKAGEYKVTAYYYDDKSDAKIRSNEILFTVEPLAKPYTAY